MSRIIAAVCGITLALAALVLPAESASADSPGCVSKREYKKVHRGMTKKRVHRVFDTHGWFVDGGAGGYARGYRLCRVPRLRVIVVYDATRKRHRLWSKKTMRMRPGAFETAAATRHISEVWI